MLTRLQRFAFVFVDFLTVPFNPLLPCWCELFTFGITCEIPTTNEGNSALAHLFLYPNTTLPNTGSE